MTPAAEAELPVGFFCSRGCSEPLKSAREAQEIDFGSLNDLLSFPLTDYPATLRQDSGPKRFRLPKSISWASRADSSGSEHPLEQETRRITQTLTRQPLFTRCCDIFTEQPPGVCGRSIKVIYRANLRLFGTFGLIAAAEGIPRSRRGNTDAKGATRTRFNRTKPHVFTHHASYRRTTYIEMF